MGDSGAGPAGTGAAPTGTGRIPARGGRIFATDTIRGRLLGIIALPVVAVLVLLTYVTVVEVSDYRVSTASTRSVSLALAVQSLTQELQTERGLTAGLLGGNAGFRDEIAPARQRVDQERAVVESEIAGGGEVEERVGTALRELDGLRAVRSAADAGDVGRSGAFQFFTDRIATLNRVDFGFDQVTDPVLRQHVEALEALNDITETTAQERAFLNGVFSAGGFARDEFDQFAAMRAAKSVALADFARHATDGEKAANDYVLDTGAAREASYFEQVAVAAANGRHLQVNPQAWWSALTTVLDGMRQMQRHVGSEIEARAQVRQGQAAGRVGTLAGIVVLCLAGALVLLVVAARSITRPLAALATEAHRLASDRLPAAVRQVQAGGGESVPRPPAPVRVPQRASSEIRSVATALDQVQAVAYALATEQTLLRRSTTESLANLGRRNQNLLRRQLGFITSLEREEADPAGLANLFELDHLATRMRRNAESLLVLVGAASPRQYAAPLPIADVIRAAVSEVEEYRRVHLRRVDDGFVAGAVVSSVAHMLAELIENGLTFSPPDSDVEIQGRRVADGYLIAITDQGIGMDADDLARANARLRGEGDFLTAPTRYLGHHVVGQLAQEMGVEVQLGPSPVTGVTARVTLPAGVLATPQAISRVEAVTGRPVEPSEPSLVAEPAEQVDASGPVVASGEGPHRAIGGRPGPVVEYVPASGAMPSTEAPTAAYPVIGGAGRSGEDSPRSPSGATGSDRPPASGGEGDRTVNGLRKRPPRDRRAGDSRPGVEQDRAGAPAAPPERSATLDGSPDEVRARLTALRAGVLRGQSERPAAVDPGDRATSEPWRGNDG